MTKHMHTHALPLSEGDGGSLSSRSSAEDMVPVDGVLGSLRLKSPEHIYKIHEFTQNNAQLRSVIIQFSTVTGKYPIATPTTYKLWCSTFVHLLLNIS